MKANALRFPANLFDEASAKSWAEANGFTLGTPPEPEGDFLRAALVEWRDVEAPEGVVRSATSVLIDVDHGVEADLAAEQDEWEERTLDREDDGDAEVVDIARKGVIHLRHGKSHLGTDSLAVYGSVTGSDEASKRTRDLFALSRLPAEQQLASAPRKLLTPDFKAGDEGSRMLSFVLSNESVDRDGDILRVSGWDLGAFRKNPLWLWQHNRGAPPIGRVRKVTKDMQAKELRVEVEFMDGEMNPLADMVYRMHKAKFLRGTSVGFLPLKINRPDDQRRAELGLGPYGIEFVKQELLEGSSVTVPANREALLASVGSAAAKGLLRPRDIELAARELTGDEAGRAAFKALEDAWACIRSLVVYDPEVERGLEAVALALKEPSHTSDASEAETAAAPGDTDLYDDLLADIDEAANVV